MRKAEWRLSTKLNECLKGSSTCNPYIIAVNKYKVGEFLHRSLFVVHCALIRHQNPSIVSKVGFDGDWQGGLVARNDKEQI